MAYIPNSDAASQTTPDPGFSQAIAKTRSEGSSQNGMLQGWFGSRCPKMVSTLRLTTDDVGMDDQEETAADASADWKPTLVVLGCVAVAVCFVFAVVWLCNPLRAECGGGPSCGAGSSVSHAPGA